MARVDDYAEARRIAAVALAEQPMDDLRIRSGFETNAQGEFIIPFLDRTYLAAYPSFTFRDVAENGREIPLQEQVLILHYMTGAKDAGDRGERVTYREIRGATFYYSAFVKRAIDPLKKVFGNAIEALETAAGKLNGRAVDIGDKGFEFRVLPRIALQIVVWRGDEEFEPEANVLFPPGIEDMLSPEDIAWLSGMLVYRLIALSR